MSKLCWAFLFAVLLFVTIAQAASNEFELVFKEMPLSYEINSTANFDFSGYLNGIMVLFFPVEAHVVLPSGETESLAIESLRDGRKTAGYNLSEYGTYLFVFNATLGELSHLKTLEIVVATPLLGFEPEYSCNVSGGRVLIQGMLGTDEGLSASLVNLSGGKIASCTLSNSSFFCEAPVEKYPFLLSFSYLQWNKSYFPFCSHEPDKISYSEEKRVLSSETLGFVFSKKDGSLSIMEKNQEAFLYPNQDYIVSFVSNGSILSLEFPALDYFEASQGYRSFFSDSGTVMHEFREIPSRHSSGFFVKNNISRIITNIGHYVKNNSFFELEHIKSGWFYVEERPERILFLDNTFNISLVGSVLLEGFSIFFSSANYFSFIEKEGQIIDVASFDEFGNTAPLLLFDSEDFVIFLSEAETATVISNSDNYESKITYPEKAYETAEIVVSDCLLTGSEVHFFSLSSKEAFEAGQGFSPDVCTHRAKLSHNERGAFLVRLLFQENSIAFPVVFSPELFESPELVLKSNAELILPNQTSTAQLYLNWLDQASEYRLRLTSECDQLGFFLYGNELVSGSSVLIEEKGNIKPELEIVSSQDFNKSCSLLLELLEDGTPVSQAELSIQYAVQAEKYSVYDLAIREIEEQDSQYVVYLYNSYFNSFDVVVEFTECDYSGSCSESSKSTILYPGEQGVFFPRHLFGEEPKVVQAKLLTSHNNEIFDEFLGNNQMTRVFDTNWHLPFSERKVFLIKNHYDKSGFAGIASLFDSSRIIVPTKQGSEFFYAEMSYLSGSESSEGRDIFPLTNDASYFPVFVYNEESELIPGFEHSAGFEFRKVPEFPSRKSIDNNDPLVSVYGTWGSAFQAKPFIGIDYLSDLGIGKQNKKVVYRLSAEKGTYNLYMHTPVSKEFSPRVPILIDAKDTSSVVFISQREDAGWTYLGRYLLDSGSTVSISALGTEGIVVADAVMLERQDFHLSSFTFESYFDVPEVPEEPEKEIEEELEEDVDVLDDIHLPEDAEPVFEKELLSTNEKLNLLLYGEKPDGRHSEARVKIGVSKEPSDAKAELFNLISPMSPAPLPDEIEIPYAELSVWEGDSSLRISYPDAGSGSFMRQGEKIKYSGDRKEVHFYKIDTEPKERNLLFFSEPKPNNLRYLNLGAIDLVSMTAYYELPQRIKTGPMLILYTTNEDGYSFYGTREADQDLRFDQIEFPVARYRTVEKGDGSFVILANKEGIFSITLYDEGISKNPDEYMDKVKQAYNLALKKYDITIITKGNFMYYIDGIRPKIVGRKSFDGDYIKMAFYLDSPLEKKALFEPVRTYLKTVLTLFPIGGLRELNSNVDYSLGEEIAENLAMLLDLELNPEPLSPQEESVLKALKSQLSSEKWIRYAWENRVPDGVEKFEVELVLHEKPDTNVFQYDLETSNLKFYYQLPPSEEEREAGDFMPEKYIGSYAVYHTKHAKIRQVGEAGEYGAGKAFHIYRPIIKDAAGKEVVGEISIDEEKGILSIIVPQEFLDTATYPVKIDPTFGYETSGGSTATLINTIRGSIYEMEDPGIIRNITASITIGKTTYASFKFAIYDEDRNFIAATSEGSGSGGLLGATTNWYTLSLTSPVILPPGDYWLVAWGTRTSGSNGVDLRYDAGSTGQGRVRSLTYAANFPDPLGGSSENRRYSVYSGYDVVYINISLDAPENNTFLNYTHVFFNYTPSTNAKFTNCSLWDNSSGSWQRRQWNSTGVTNGSINSFNRTYSSDGVYIWNVECCTEANCGFSSANYTFEIDTVLPNIQIHSPLNETYYNRVILVNISASDKNLEDIWYNWNGTDYPYTGTFNILVNEGSSNTLQVWANDSAGNLNYTNVTFTHIIIHTYAVSPANGTVLDRDSLLSEPDQTDLIVQINGEFEGLEIFFYSNLTYPDLARAKNVLLGSALTNASGHATFTFNPNSSIYAGNHTWWGYFPSGTTYSSGIINTTKQFYVYGGANLVFSEPAANPNPEYNQTESLYINATVNSLGPESVSELASYYSPSFYSLLQLTNSSEVNLSLSEASGFWTSSLYEIPHDAPLGYWNATLGGTMNYFAWNSTALRSFFVYGLFSLHLFDIQDLAAKTIHAGVNADFYGNLTTLSNISFSDANCDIEFAKGFSGGTMSYSAIDQLYLYDRLFYFDGTIYYNATCTHPNYRSAFDSNTINITGLSNFTYRKSVSSISLRNYSITVNITNRLNYTKRWVRFFDFIPEPFSLDSPLAPLSSYSLDAEGYSGEAYEWGASNISAGGSFLLTYNVSADDDFFNYSQLYIGGIEGRVRE